MRRESAVERPGRGSPAHVEERDHALADDGLREVDAVVIDGTDFREGPERKVAPGGFGPDGLPPAKRDEPLATAAGGGEGLQ